MNAVHRVWWRALLDTRPLLRFAAERFPRLAPTAIRLRAVAHLCVGHPTPILISLTVLLAMRAGAGFNVAGVVGLVALIAAEAVHRWRFETGRGGWFIGWREAWRVHRRMPSLWAEGAAKTAAVQAEVGTSKKPVASARLRPIADHPKMGWWPKIEWPQVSWWVGPPPGRTFEQFESVLEVLATNYSRCIGMSLDYDRVTDSYARFTVSFGSVLDNTIQPETTEVDNEPWTPSDSPSKVLDLPLPDDNLANLEGDGSGEGQLAS